MILDLSLNSLSGPLPDAWEVWVSLSRFAADGNHLGGNLPAGWSALQNMQILSLAGEVLGAVMTSDPDAAVNGGD
jgi:hypothetical protein